MGNPSTPLPGELAKTQTAPAAPNIQSDTQAMHQSIVNAMGDPRQIPDVSPMLRTMQQLQSTFGFSPQDSAALTRGLYAPVMNHPEMQRWLAIAYPQPQPPAAKNPQEAASRLAQMALLFGQRQ